jgi:tripartite-type tricarboxylate transporter receptor subunit TctC
VKILSIRICHFLASYNIGAESVFRAPPDGYTLLMTPPPPLVINQNLNQKLAFEPATFVPVTVIASVPSVLVATPGLPVSAVKDLIAYARANPDKLSFGSSGVGSTPHLNMEWLNTRAAIRTTHVPYGSGLGPALTDLMAGRIHLAI